MGAKLTNNATSKLAAALTSSSTSLSITPGDGTKFPTLAAGDWHPLTVVRASDAAFEIMRVNVPRNTDTFTVLRAQEGTAALTFAAGDRVEVRFTEAVFDEMEGLIQGALQKSGGTVAGNLAVIGDLSMTGLIQPSTTKGIKGTVVADNAQAGSVGEHLEATVPFGSALSIGTGVPTNVVGLNLTPGDWDVYGYLTLVLSNGTQQFSWDFGISSVSGGLVGIGSPGRGQDYNAMIAPNGGTLFVSAHPVYTRFNVTANTPVFLITLNSYASGSIPPFCQACGSIQARRVR